MASAESKVMMASLLSSLSEVPPTAIPPMLDCILVSTNLSPLSLFTCLLDSFSNLTVEHGKLDSDKNDHVVSLVYSVCHLLRKIGKDDSSLKLFISRCFIPLSRMVNENGLEILNQAAESLCDITTDTSSWEVVEKDLVPVFLRSISSSMGMLQNEGSDIYEWSRFSVSIGSDKHINDTGSEKQPLPFQNGSIPLSISCDILASVLNAALQHQQTTGTLESILPNGCHQVNNFAAKLLGVLCSLSLQMLSQSSKHRICAIHFLLPTIFNAFISFQYSEILSDKQKQEYLSCRKDFSIRIWKCCRTLFAVGPVERRDAYNALSLYLSCFPPNGAYKHVDLGNTKGEFDIGAEKEFWDQIKEGLVDKESFVRKQSLHILKRLVLTKEESPRHPNVPETFSHDKKSISKGMTKRGLWAEKEARSMGVGKINNLNDSLLTSKQRWEAFILLYETLEEYGTHLVEAAWNYQITLLIHSSSENVSSMSERARQNQMEIPGPGRFSDWLTVLWERGFNHDNPHVRCLIMQSFLEIEWTNHEDIVKYLPESFVLGPFIQGLNDPVHHKDFGVKGNYTSRIIEDAAKFLQQFTRYFNKREHLAFLNNLASIAKKQSFGRAGLMGLVECISSAACGVQVSEVGWNVDAFPDGVLSFEETSLRTSRADFLDVLRFIIEMSRQHFNHNYRLRVCERVLEAAASTMSTFDLPLGTLLLFISVLPTEFTDNRGSLRAKLLEWLSGCCRKSLRTNCCSNKMMLLNNLYDFSTKFISHDSSASGFLTYDDEDLEAWHLEAKRWARVLFLVIRAEHHLEPLLMFIQDHARNMCQQIEEVEQYSMRFIVLILSLVEELQMVHERFYFGRSSRNEVDPASREMLALSDSAEAYNVLENFSNCLGIILVELVSYAHLSCLVFWDYTIIKDMSLPSSIKGKLGGPSQRRLSSSATSTVLKAIMSMKTLSIVLSFCTQFDHWYSLDSAFTFLWKFFWNVVSSSSCSSGVGAEIGLAACEALVPVLKALASTFFPFAVSILRKNQLWPAESERCVPLLDSLVVTSIQHINSLLTVGELARSRRAVLIDWKWLCLESLLSVPLYALENGMRDAFLSDSTKRLVFCDLVESLENAGEGSVLPMLRSLRLLFGLFSSGRLDSCRDHIDAQMMWSLIRSSWIMHVSCKKRRIAPISALLSSVLHPLIFGDESFHSMYNEPGPLKWFIGKILEEGTKSPRTIRLAALHLTGLWLVYPRIIQYYIKELILISLHGSVAFDEDFEAELAENNDAKSEVSLLAKSVDPGLTEAFINTELYARISVSVLFSKLADMADSVGSGNESKDCLAALESGKLFLLELLDFVVNNVDLRKELYKKYSAIHRRKARAWQMLCVLSRFVRNDIVQQVTHDLHLCLYRNNLPSVRQYLESFAINLYLRFPSLVAEQLVPILQDHEMRPQALSSYVFIAANVILHAPKEVQSWHLNELFPPIIPLLTSHHHSLRGFTQLLVYQVLCKQSLVSDSHGPETPLAKRCFEDLKLYLSKNSDCARLRASMEGYLDEFDPKMSVSPAGIFTSRVEVQEFECVPRSLMEQVLEFLNDARDDLRCSMAKDAMTIKNESISGLSEISERSAGEDGQPDELHNDLAVDFQKKITLSKHESHTVFSSWRDTKVYKSFSEMEKEDLLLDQVLQLRSVAMERIRASQQPLILVASLIDRIPNLAGLARTCEVFKASTLAVADTSILHDKQFQLISVTAEKWVPIVEVPVSSMKLFLGKKKKEGFSILGLEQTANSIPLDQFNFPQKTVLVLGREKEGIPVDIIHILDACIEIPQLGVVRSLNVHVSGAIALWEYTRQRRLQ